MNRFKLCFALALGIFAAASTAQAENTRLPAFGPETNLYVASAVKDKVHFSSEFSYRLRERARENNLNVYVVAVEQGDDLKAYDIKNWARDINHRSLWDQWVREGMSEARSVLVLHIRERGTNRSATSVRVGSYLHGIGLTRDFISKDDGIIRPVVAQYGDDNPEAGIIKVLDNINAEIAKRSASRLSSSSESSGFNPAWLLLFIGVPLGLLLIIGLASSGSSGSGRKKGSGSCSSCGAAGCSGGGSGGCGGGGCGS
jgi:hypothetical protein